VKETGMPEFMKSIGGILMLKGVVHGAWSVDAGVRPIENFKVLGCGQSEEIAPGSAVALLDRVDDEGAHCRVYEMPAGGRLEGPMLWGAVDPAPEADLVRHWTRRDHRRDTDALGLLMATAVLLLALPATYLASRTLPAGIDPKVALIVIGVVSVGGFLLTAIQGPDWILARRLKRERRTALDLGPSESSDEVRVHPSFEEIFVEVKHNGPEPIDTDALRVKTEMAA
jgi:hypothetical protein